MPIISQRGYRPEPADWVLSDVNSLADLGKKLRRRQGAPSTEEDQLRWNNWVEANEFWQTGADIWVVDSEHTLAFASEPRYVPQDDLSFCLDEIISEAAYLLDEDCADKDLTDADIQSEIINALEGATLVVKDSDVGLLFDSFASEEDFSTQIVPVVEQWECKDDKNA